NRRGDRERACSLLGAAAPPLRPAFIGVLSPGCVVRSDGWTCLGGRVFLPDSRIATNQYGRGPGERSTRTRGPPPPAAAVTLRPPRRYNTPAEMNSRRASPPAAGKQPETAASPWRASRERLRDRAVKREAVIRAAAREFNRKGYHNTSLDDIAARLEVTKPTVYYYVTSKEQLLFQCFVAGVEQIRAAFRDVRHLKVPARERLNAVLRHYGEAVASEFGWCMVRAEDQDLSPAMSRHIKALKSEIDHGIRRLIREGVQDGSIQPCDPKMTAFALAGALQGALTPLTAVQLGAAAAKAAIAAAGIDAAELHEVIMGCVLPAGLGQAPARQAAVGAGVPVGVPCTTVNKMCGSGLKAVMLAADQIRAASAQVVLAGGLESMSNAPYLL